MIKLLLILASLLLAGCFSASPIKDEQGYEWSLTRVPVPKSQWTYEYYNDIELVCGIRAKACSKRYMTHEPRCEILLPRKPEPWLVEHEEKHCMGWTHGPRSR